MDKRICLITSCVLILSYAVVGRDFRTEAEEKSYVTINEVENINLSFTNLEENQDHIPSQVDEGIEGSKDNLSMSTRLEVEFAFNLERTSENPLRARFVRFELYLTACQLFGAYLVIPDKRHSKISAATWVGQTWFGRPS